MIRKYLLKLVDDIDAGNSNLTESEAIELIDTLKRLADKEKGLSKYEACKYLNVSRATFDNYVREGRLPKGTKEAWFGDNIDTKVIESAVNFWFKDDDYKGGNKVYKYFREA